MNWRKTPATPLLAATLILLLLTAAGDFLRRMESTVDRSAGQRLGVVFTGQFERVREALALLERGHVQRLLVSGVNAGAGMTIDGFADQFELSENLRRALIDGRLTLDEHANTTLDNALDTRCWLNDEPVDLPVLLITSARHMPRASVLLERVLGGREVQRLSITEPTGYSRTLTEFLKYLATVSLGILIPLHFPNDCQFDSITSVH